MTENEIGKIVVDTALAVHRDLGPDFWRVFTRLFRLGSCSYAGSVWSVKCRCQLNTTESNSTKGFALI